MSSRINWGDYIKDKCQSLLERSTKLLFFSETIFLNFVLVAVDSTERLLLESLQDSVLFSFINLLIIYQLILAFLKLTIPRKKRKECSMQIWNSFFFGYQQTRYCNKPELIFVYKPSQRINETKKALNGQHCIPLKYTKILRSIYWWTYEFYISLSRTIINA